MAKYVVEVYGVARTHAGEREIEVELGPGATLGDVLAALGRQAPALVGSVLEQDARSLRPPYVLNMNGLSFVEDLSLRPQAGDRILLMAPPAGG
ncbi:MAG TPA: MoaD/ThiS family protein [Dehalococcoidia bacterium]|nr:MoaD/ThiS family protein [Dehalococcoidia bacterium]